MEHEVKMARRLASLLLAKGAYVIVDNNEYEIKGTLEEVEKEFSDFRIWHKGCTYRVLGK